MLVLVYGRLLQKVDMVEQSKQSGLVERLPRGRGFQAEIRRRLMSEIQQRSIDDLLPAETELARQFGVNRLTVNRVMTELLREGYIRRVRGKGTFVHRPTREVHTSGQLAALGVELGGMPVVRGESKTKAKRGEIVLAYPDYFAYDLWKKVNSAEELAHQYEVELVNFKMARGTEHTAVARMIRERRTEVAGAILMSPSALTGETIGCLDELGIPVVVLGATEHASTSRNVISVYRDYYKEGYLAVDHLIRAGHKHIGYVANEPWNHGSKLQFNGVKAALYAHRLNLKDLVRSPSGIEPWENSLEGGYRYTAEMLKTNPEVTGIMYRSIPGAAGGLKAIWEAGKTVPKDLSIVAEGEMSSWEEYLTPPLTKIVCDYTAWVRTAFDAILNPERRTSRQIGIDVQLVEMKSVRKLTETQG